MDNRQLRTEAVEEIAKQNPEQAQTLRETLAQHEANVDRIISERLPLLKDDDPATFENRFNAIGEVGAQVPAIYFQWLENYNRSV